MTAFDRLPRSFRDALNYAPFNLDAAGLEQGLRRYGERAAGAAVRETLAQALSAARREIEMLVAPQLRAR